MSKKELESIRSTEAVAHLIASRCPFDHKGLRIVVLSGSQGNSTFGDHSDVDVCTLMRSEDPSRVDIQNLVEMAGQLNLFCHCLNQDSGVSPVVISTIRMEEAQIAIASMLSPDRPVAAIHWLHYPSVEFLATNEPPGLARGLLCGQVLKGDLASANHSLDLALQNPTPELVGLDWLTDSLRILLANAPVDNTSWFPLGFLKRHATHNLDYFWKWRLIVPLIEKACQTQIIEWPKAKALAPDICPQLVKIYDEVRHIRHHSEETSIDQIVDLHDTTFAIWPTQ